jgi:hypothetical protein
MRPTATWMTGNKLPVRLGFSILSWGTMGLGRLIGAKEKS